MKKQLHRYVSAFGIAIVCLGVSPVFSQEGTPAPTLNLELNAAQPTQNGCRLTFVVNNALGDDLSKAAFEIALFNDSGIVDRLTVLDFKDLPAGKTKVVRFDLAGTDCTKISRVLINNATECLGTSIKPTACLDSLKTISRTGIQFGL